MNFRKHVLTMISDPPLYRGSGGGVKAHSIRRRKTTPPVMRQRTLPESPVTSVRPVMTRQRSLSPSRILNSPQRTPRRHLSTTNMVSMSNMRQCSDTGVTMTRRGHYSSMMIHTSNRRLVLALDQFTCTALPFYIELITRYTHKIQKVK